MPESSARNGSEDVEQIRAGLDVAVLKRVYEKCTKNYEGKYRSALFGINVRLDDAELTQIGLLIDEAKRLLGQFADSHPAYPKFNTLLHEMREKLGTFGESGRIIGDPSATTVAKDLINETVPAIRAPSAVKDLYTWTLCAGGIEEMLNTYRSGKARALSAKGFGMNLKEICRFVREAKYPDQGGH